MKKVISLILCLVMILSLNVSVFASENVTFTMSSAEAEAGGEATLTVDVSNNIGLTGVTLSLSYDTSVLTLESYSNGTVFTSAPSAGKNYVWYTGVATYTNGTLISFVFEVNASAVGGEYPVEIILRECLDADMNDVVPTVISGSITVPTPEAEESVSVATAPEASVRISEEHSGLRFKTVINKSAIDELIALYGAENVKVGTVIAPTDTLTGVSEFTMAELDAAGIPYVNVKATLDRPFATDATTNTYTGSLANIKQKNLNRDFSAVGYISYTDAEGNVTYVYSESVAVRSVTFVAKEALNTFSDTQEGKYQYPVVVDGVTKYSRYDETQRAILKKLVYDFYDPYDKDIFGN